VSGSSSKAAVSSATQSSAPATKTTIKLATLKGPTGLGMLKLMSDNDAKTAANNYAFTLVSSPDEIVSKIATGEIDAAAVPTNLAATLYNKTSGKVQLAAINTLGVLSVLTNGENIASVKDLKGKTIYASGQGSTPEYALNYILKQNGLEVDKDVKVEYKAEHAELAALVISGKAKIAVLPEPFVTQVMIKNKGVKIALNVTEEWNKVAGDKSVLTMGCLIVRKDFAEKNKAAFDKFLDEYKASAAYTTSSVNAAAALSEKYGVMPAAVAKKAIPNCNIVYIDGADMKAKIPDFLKILFTANPKSVGGKLPGDDFYYTK
jgi:NitT/TauT family transport system substrate-binding protein